MRYTEEEMDLMNEYETFKDRKPNSSCRIG